MSESEPDLPENGILVYDPKTRRIIRKRPNTKKRGPRKKTEDGAIAAFEAGPPRVYCYIRVSTAKQDQSPADQRQICQTLAERNGLVIESYYQDAPIEGKDLIYNDAQSGKISFADRPAGSELAKLLRPGAGDVIIVSKMDRLFRKLSDMVMMLDRWERLGVKLLAGDFPMFANLADPYAKALMQMVGVFAELERKMIAQRTKEAMACRIRVKRAVNNSPRYGFKLERRRDPETGVYKKFVVSDPEERKIMAQIVTWRLGGATWEQMYFHMLKLGIKTRKGTEWSRMRILRVFRAELVLQMNENKR